MLPYPTTSRRLLMMVRSFVHHFEDYLGTHWHGSTYPSDAYDESADHELGAFLERLAMEVDEDDESISAWTEVETEDEIRQSLEEHLRDLLRRASWNDERKLSAN